MHRKGHVSRSRFHAISLAAIAASMMAMVMVRASAQNSVPPTATQAARVPEFASRLATPAQPALSPLRRHRASSEDNVVYENGPVNGSTDAFPINFGFSVTDSVQANRKITAVEFYVWLFPGDTLTSVDVTLGSQPFGSDLFQGTINLVQSDCQTNTYGFSVCFESGTISDGPTLGGAAWMTLQNAVVPSGDPVYWDENSGVGCHSSGCPSQAESSFVGTIPSEAFDLKGDEPLSCYPYDLNWKQVGKAAAHAFQVIYNFLGGQEGANPLGLTIDRGGNFYGTTFAGGKTTDPCGSNGCGTVFRLSRHDSGWMVQTLYRFSGEDNNKNPSSRVTLGPDGRLYGVTWAGHHGDLMEGGVVYSLQPPAHVCPNASCSWTQTVLHRFAGYGGGEMRLCSLQGGSSNRQWAASPEYSYDELQPIGDVAFDSAGSLYGTTRTGMGSGDCFCGFSCGFVYKLTPSGKGWLKEDLHEFHWADGELPESGIILDSNGTIYGTTTKGGHGGGGTVFQMSSQSFNVLHEFGSNDRNGSRATGGLIYDQEGNFYGTTSQGGIGCGGCGCGTAFEMPNASDFTSLYAFTASGGGPGSGPASALVRDAEGNLYGTTVAEGAYGHGSVFKLTPGLAGWTYTDLYDFTGGADGATPSGLTMDGNGHLWGTTTWGGAFGFGTIFEITP